MNTTQTVLDLLLAAANAHGVHETQDLGGVHDENWPQWYAQHITGQLEERGLRIVRI